MKKNRIVIIGGLSAGPSAAAKARRMDEHAEIIMFEKTSHISYATCGIPYAMSGKIKTRDKLMVVQPELLRTRFKIDVRLNETVHDIDPVSHTVYSDKGTYQYDKLIVTTGGRAMLPPISNIDTYKNWGFAKTIEDFDRIMKRGVIDKSEHVTIVGGGLIGLETAENLIDAGKKVTIIELGDQILANWDAKFARMAQTELTKNGIDLRLGISVQGVDPNSGELMLSDGSRLFTDFLLISISVKPNTEILTSRGADHLPNGALLVNERMETSLPDIYAAGDCASVPNMITDTAAWFPMGTHSNKGGRAAGANAAGGDETFSGGYGTAILKLFDYTVARTGLNPANLRKAGIPFKSSMIVSSTTPGFYPDPKDLYLEIYYHPETGRLLGAEMIGEHGVDKRVDVLATAIYAKLTIHDLPRLDLAYAPPYSTAKDPVIVVGYTAENAQNGYFEEIDLDKAAQMIEDVPSLTVLDVRTRSEVHNLGSIPGSINIPIDELRDELDKLDSRNPILVYCARGLRGYLSSVILTHHHFEKVYNLAGGFASWSNMKVIDKELDLDSVGSS